MSAMAAGMFRRTPIERSDQRVSWERTDHAFFAAGACHILAWVCRETYREVGVMAMFLVGEEHPVHLYARWRGWAFDFSGWNPEDDLLRVNALFEKRPVEGVSITVSLPSSAIRTSIASRISTGAIHGHAPART
jgi:hypothetical protein